MTFRFDRDTKTLLYGETVYYPVGKSFNHSDSDFVNAFRFKIGLNGGADVFETANRVSIVLTIGETILEGFKADHGESSKFDQLVEFEQKFEWLGLLIILAVFALAIWFIWWLHHHDLLFKTTKP